VRRGVKSTGGVGWRVEKWSKVEKRCGGVDERRGVERSFVEWSGEEWRGDGKRKRRVKRRRGVEKWSGEEWRGQESRRETEKEKVYQRRITPKSRICA
jgi:hypothetical protein